MSYTNIAAIRIYSALNLLNSIKQFLKPFCLIISITNGLKKWYIPIKITVIEDTWAKMSLVEITSIPSQYIPVW
jgi:hypothetical protein